MKEIDESDPLLGRCFGQHAADYKALSATPHSFDAFVAACRSPWRSANMTSSSSASTPNIWRAASPARFVLLPGVSHFAPIQRAGLFDAAVLEFLAALP